MNDEELIKELRERAEDLNTGSNVAQCMREAADALATRVPVQGEPNDGPDFAGLIQAIKQTGGSVEIAGVKIMPCDEYGRTAAIPDAATEHVRDAWRKDHRFMLAKLDAALAAVERVRAIHQKRGASWPHNGGVYVCVADNGLWPCPTIAALDGAPEPEVKP